MANLTSNIPSKNFCFTFVAGILQTIRTTSKCQTFCKTSENLPSRISKQCDNITLFARTRTKIYGGNFEHLKNFIILFYSLKVFCTGLDKTIFLAFSICWYYEPVFDMKSIWVSGTLRITKKMGQSHKRRVCWCCKLSPPKGEALAKIHG